MASAASDNRRETENKGFPPAVDPRKLGSASSLPKTSRYMYSYRIRCDIIYDMRLVVDTSVVVAALRSPSGASAAIMRLARQQRVILLMSVALATEYEAVCRLPEHRLAAGLSEREVDIFLTTIIALAEPVETHFFWRPQLRDPSDEMVLEAAVNGRADALITFNLRDFGMAPLRFGIELLVPREVMARIRQ
jgi:putative PIN family toxin of toxin-antitoxin system